eukprot:scaffold99186_cov47-Attheya_sp.AAC.2
MHLDQSSATVAFLSSVLLPCEKCVVLWWAVCKPATANPARAQQQVVCACLGCYAWGRDITRMPTSIGMVRAAWGVPM